MIKLPQNHLSISYDFHDTFTPSELQSVIIPDPLIVKRSTKVMDVIAQMSGVRVTCNTSKTVDGELDEFYLEVRSSCVLVVENDKIIGIFTERDVVSLSAKQCP